MRILCYTALAALGLSGCAAKPLQPGAEHIYLSSTAPAAQCRYLGEVRGAQGNFWTAEFTSDEALLMGARNELRNRAATLGANYVTIETEHYSENTTLDSLGGVYAAVIVGNAWRCELNRAPTQAL